VGPYFPPFLFFAVNTFMNPYSAQQLIDFALIEDLGDGDHTSIACVPSQAKGSALLLVKDDGIIAGVEEALLVINKVDPEMVCDVRISDGTAVKKGDVVFELHGLARSILAAERLLLNIMQRMSGIATITAQVVKKLEGTGTKVLDTRKTTPGLRYFEKKAVKLGGGVNHRFGLYDMILVKDNHIDFAGGIPQALSSIENYLLSINKSLKIEVEARNLNEVQEILDFGKVDRILLDNFTPDELKKAVVLINHRCETEASGGITIENCRIYAEQGVDYISMGALTHSVKSLDLSLKAKF
jgi:nicotinate-nucleotide pyrophosphorylase (carboxylating)